MITSPRQHDDPPPALPAPNTCAALLCSVFPRHLPALVILARGAEQAFTFLTPRRASGRFGTILPTMQSEVASGHRTWPARSDSMRAEPPFGAVTRPPVWLLRLRRGNVLAGGGCPVTAGGPGAGAAAAGAAGLCGLGVVVAGRVSAGGFAVVGDGGHQLAGAAEPVEGRAQAGEVVHERFEEPAWADADDDLGLGAADGVQRGRGDLLRAY